MRFLSNNGEKKGDLTEKKTKKRRFWSDKHGASDFTHPKTAKIWDIWGSPYQNGGWRRFDRSGICGLPSSGLMWMQIKSYGIIGGEICEQISRKGEVVRFVSFTLPRCICLIYVYIYNIIYIIYIIYIFGWLLRFSHCFLPATIGTEPLFSYSCTLQREGKMSLFETGDEININVIIQMWRSSTNTFDN